MQHRQSAWLYYSLPSHVDNIYSVQFEDNFDFQEFMSTVLVSIVRVVQFDSLKPVCSDADVLCVFNQSFPTSLGNVFNSKAIIQSPQKALIEFYSYLRTPLNHRSCIQLQGLLRSKRTVLNDPNHISFPVKYGQ